MPKKKEYSGKSREDLLFEIEKLKRSNLALKKDVTEIKNVEKIIPKSEEEYRTLIHQIPIGIYRTTIGGHIIFANEALAKILGYDKIEDLFKITVMDLFVEKKSRTKEISDWKECGGINSSELKFLKKDGDQIWVRDTGRAIINNLGDIVYFDGVIEDISDWKKSDQIIKEKNEFIDKIIESSALSTWISDEKGTAIRANPACFEFFGASEDEVIGKYNILKDSVIEKAGFLPEIKNVFEKGIAANIIIDYNFADVDHVNIKKPAHKITNSIFTPILDNNKKVSNVIVQAIDLTDIIKAKEDLQLSKLTLDIILDNTNDAIIKHDLNGKIIEVNKTMLDMYQITKEQALNLSIMDISGPEMSLNTAKSYWKSALQGEKIVFEWQAKRPNDMMVFYVEVALKKIKIGNDEFVLGNIRDLTQAKKAEEEKAVLEAQLNQSHKMEAIGTLAGGIAHNFNNILMGIQGYTSLMKLHMDPSQSDYKYLNNIDKAISSAVELTRQLLGFARGGRYEVKPINLNELIKNENRVFGQTKKEIRITGKYEKNPWIIEADQGQLQQVLLNLYVNAWQAMPKGGNIYIQTANVIIDDGYRKHFKIIPGKYVRLSVTDTGIGIDKDIQKKIFDPFFTTKDRGRNSGLGLASVYGIIKNHRGFINIYSEKGHGTTFNIYFPVSNKEVFINNIGETEIVNGVGTILLVDDEPMVSEVGKELLMALGYKVLTAESGDEAIQIYKEKQEYINLIILDMIMPVIGGEETFEKLKEIDPEVNVLLSSGYSLNGQAEEILSNGCKGFLQKPYSLSDLSEKVRSVLEVR